jgi:hypothetical protein
VRCPCSRWWTSRKLSREQVDRLSRAKHVRVVALDLPTSWLMAAKADEFTGRMCEAINGMLLDMLAAVARKDYDDRRRRQAQGQARQRPRANTGGASRTLRAMPASPPCYRLARAGALSRPPPAAVAQLSLRSPSGRPRPPEGKRSVDARNSAHADAWAYRARAQDREAIWRRSKHGATDQPPFRGRKRRRIGRR